MSSPVTTTVESDGKPHGGGRTRTSGGKLVHEGPQGEFSALLTVDEVAGLLCCSARTVSRMADAAAMPPPLKILSLVRYRRTDIDQWLTDGCPRCDRRAKS